MFLLSLPFTVIHHTVTYLYPLYASYKAISSHQSQHGITKSVTGEERTELAELETWLMYWSIVGAMHILEGWAEWAWSWLPFYYLAKLAFTLWLVLPQTRGATLLYTTYLGPFLQAHEGDIDVALASARRRASEVAGKWIMTLWQQVRSAILGAAMSSDPSSSATPEPGPTQTPPTLQNPASGSTSQLFSLLKHYGPLAAAGVVSAMDKAAAQAAHATGTQSPSASVPSTGPEAKATASSRSTSLGAGVGAGVPTTRSRSNLSRGTGTARTSSRLAPPSAPSRGAGRDTSSSDWSEDEEAAGREGRGGSTRRRTTSGAKQDLSGSYQLVGDDVLTDEHEPEGRKETQMGSDTPAPTSAGGNARSSGGGGEKGWAAWLTGR